MRTLSEIYQGMGETEFNLRGARDPAFWITRVLGETNFNFSAPMHKEWIELYQKNRLLMILAPTGFSKTQLFAVGMGLWTANYERNKALMIVSELDGQAKGILKRIKDEIADNELLINLKPENPEVWNMNDIETKNRITIFSKPFNEGLRSFHADIVIADEVSKYKDHSIFFEYLVTRVNARNGKLVAISTAESATDLTQKLLNNDMFTGRIYPAQKKSYIIDRLREVRRELNKPDWISPIYDTMEEDESMFPYLYTKERLAEIEKVNPIAFHLMYLCDVQIATGTPMSPAIVIPCLDNTLDFMLEPQGGSVVMGCDFAYSDSPDADYSVFTVIESIGGKHYIRMMERYKGKPISFQQIRIEELARIYKPTKIFIDESNIGVNFVQELRNKFLPIVPCKFDISSRSKYIVNLINIVQDTLLVIPWKFGGIHESVTKQLYNELTGVIPVKTQGGYDSFANTAGHDDCCFVAGTLITTPEGQIPIERLKIGDYVVTRKGAKKIIATGNRLAPVIGRFGLTGTSEHPIFTAKGIRKLGYLKETDITYIWNLKSSCIEESPIGDIRNRNEGNYEFITGIMENGNHHQLLSTGKYGLTTLVQLPKALLSIIKIAIPSTMIYPTLNSCSSHIIHPNTSLMRKKGKQENALRKTGQRYERNLKQDGGKVRNSENMEGKMQYLPTTHQNMNTNAYTVKRYSLAQESPRLSIVPKNVEVNIERVYNLSIEDEPEYFANLILVHNCMSLAMAVSGIRKEGPELKKIFYTD